MVDGFWNGGLGVAWQSAAMNCPNCGASAESGANYCVRCGGRLPMTCSNCRAISPPDSRFCQACGSALGAAEPVRFRPVQNIPCPRCHADNGPGATFCYACGLPLDEQAPRQAETFVAGGVPAGFWIRLLAWFIDFVVLIVAELLLIAVLPGISIEAYFAEEFSWDWYDTFLTLVNIAYYVIGVSAFSTTVGKRVLGLYVLRRDGSKIGLGRAFARYLAYIPSMMLLGIGYLMIGFSRNKRGLHDYICDTVVVEI